MKRKQRIPHYVSIYLRYLHQDTGDKCSEIVKRFPMYSERSIYRHASLPVGLNESFSVDSVVVDGDIDDDTYPIDFLNSLTPSGVPPHILLLKRGAVVMLLKNLHLKAGLTNGSRLIIKNIFQHLINVEILSVYHHGQRHYLSKMLFQPSDSGFPLVLK